MDTSRALLLLALVVGCSGDDSLASGSEIDSETGSGTSSGTDGSTSDPSAGSESSTTGSTGSTSAATEGSSTGEPDGIAPDFGLVDVNDNSPSFEQEVSPRDYLEQVSGWYYAHAT